MKNTVELKILAEITNISDFLKKHKKKRKPKHSDLPPKTLSVLDDVEFFLTNAATSKIAHTVFSDNLHDLAVMLVSNRGESDAKTD